MNAVVVSTLRRALPAPRGFKLLVARLVSSRLLRFCIVGASGVVVDMLLLYLLGDPQMLGFGLTRSKLAAAEVAVFSNFLFNDAWTFGDVARVQPGWRARLRRFVGFNAVCGLGIGLNVLLLNLLFNVGHLDRYLANALAILVVAGWNYWISSHLNWSSPRAAAGSGEQRASPS
jgi:dolichol-phosphate mannosyltransferase